jgi:hypothetical protein
MEKSIGSMRDFKARSQKIINITKNETKVVKTIEFDDIETEDYNENKLKAIQTLKSPKEQDEKSKYDAYHKVLADEVPKWYNMTIDEAAHIIQKHICYFNIERT